MRSIGIDIINTNGYFLCVVISWDSDKDKLLRDTRNVCFSQVKQEIEEGRFIGPETNPAHPEQSRIIVSLN